ncbi:MAG: glycoside hydrolase family 127 protein [Planctomycetes bacterium]|nr:glycoside hydrolase family 127 protein [Planctomycetota bacterium]
MIPAIAIISVLPSLLQQIHLPSRLEPVPFTQVRLEDAFWAPRLETNRLKTVPHNIRTCESTGRLANFARAAGLEPGEFQGIYFNDSDVFKMIEGASYTLAGHPDPALEADLDRIIAKIAAAQQPDGYLNTYYTLVEKGKRWTDLPVKHELYCAGHLFEAAVAHFQATGKRTLLDVARRYADHIDSVFGPEKQHGVAGHEEIELALVKLHRITGEKRYLDLAKFFLDERGRDCKRKLYGDYCQDHLPVREQSDIRGHAVRAMYLYTGVADAAALTGDPGFIGAMDRLWQNVVYKKMYITGGIGPSAHNEGFTVDYDLPNDSAYAETCASIGMALWNHRLFLLHGEGRFGDVLEQVLYNGLLSGVSLDGEKFFYVNPLASRGRHHRQPWFDCACCPTNIVRFLPSLGGYVYARKEDSLWVNLYIAGKAKIPMPAAGAVQVVQETDYPWSGKVRLRIEPENEAAPEFTLALRIPGWCRGAAASLNGAPIDMAAAVKGILPIRRLWKKGDAVDLDLPMPVRRVESHPAVKGNQGRVALRRGPLVYCLEGADHSISVRRIALPRDAQIEAEHVPSLLGGVTVLRGAGVVSEPSGWSEEDLYREAPAPKKVAVTAIPYYAWDHRQPGEMVVWIPEDPALAEKTSDRH